MAAPFLQPHDGMPHPSVSQCVLHGALGVLLCLSSTEELRAKLWHTLVHGVAAVQAAQAQVAAGLTRILQPRQQGCK